MEKDYKKVIKTFVLIGLVFILVLNCKNGHDKNDKNKEKYKEKLSGIMLSLYMSPEILDTIYYEGKQAYFPDTALYYLAKLKAIDPDNEKYFIQASKVHLIKKDYAAALEELQSSKLNTCKEEFKPYNLLEGIVAELNADTLHAKNTYTSVNQYYKNINDSVSACYLLSKYLLDNDKENFSKSLLQRVNDFKPTKEFKEIVKEALPEHTPAISTEEGIRRRIGVEVEDLMDYYSHDRKQLLERVATYSDFLFFPDTIIISGF